MRRSRFAEDQILMTLRQAEGGTTVADICRTLEITEGTFYRWKKQFAELGIAGVAGAPGGEIASSCSWLPI